MPYVDFNVREKSNLVHNGDEERPGIFISNRSEKAQGKSNKTVFI